MTATARIDASPSMQVMRLDPRDPLLRWWLTKLYAQNPHFSHARGNAPGCWLGLYILGYLRAAIGFTLCADGTVLVDYIVCEPTKIGRAAMIALAASMKEQWRDRTIRFFCELRNRKVRKILEALGGVPQALLYEITPDKGV